MSGIYIHIPYCKRACSYCNFHFSTQAQSLPDFILALQEEIVLRRDYLTTPVETIYFGGGTPSICTAQQIENILDAIHQQFAVKKNIEITLEANPDDISIATLQAWKSIGINRLSLGVQSLEEDTLRWMNRTHTAQQSLVAIDWISKYFENFSVDLIYGDPFLTHQQWGENLVRVTHFKVPHIAAYALTVEPKTALYHQINTHQTPSIANEKQAEQFEILVEILAENGYQNYEISNFAQTNFQSKHNSAYWQDKPYLGLGPGAHSYNHTARQWNIAHNQKYIQSLKEKTLCYEEEILTPIQKMNENIMLSLRTAKGINCKEFEKKFDEKSLTKIFKKAQKWLDSKHLETRKDYLMLSPKAKFLADGIAADLFF